MDTTHYVYSTYIIRMTCYRLRGSNAVFVSWCVRIMAIPASQNTDSFQSAISKITYPSKLNR